MWLWEFRKFTHPKGVRCAHCGDLKRKHYKGKGRCSGKYGVPVPPYIAYCECERFKKMKKLRKVV